MGFSKKARGSIVTDGSNLAQIGLFPLASVVTLVTSLRAVISKNLVAETPFVEARSNADIAPCLSVITPVYNEGATVAQVLRRVLQQRPVQELIVVDDCSVDNTWKALQELGTTDPRLRLVRHEKNRGKGAALRTGFQHATAPIIIIQDADLEYDPAEYFLVLNPILSGKADVVFGSRFGGATAHRVLYYWHSVGNKFLTTLSNMATNLNLTDMETCYKTFRREVLQQITIEEDRFGFEPEITAKVSKLNVRIYEVAISYYGRTYDEGKKINWKDGLSALRCILKYNLLR
ncbi:MAG TPA: glycosyltransferase family 2 protein [Candidatus Acidoferrum sp.]|nr:glycosyltransferase family 2 protein [Candidatus Acidoferrum sp.]